jgi:DNA modification methylase
MADASADAIVTDPPYGQSNESYDRGVSPEVWRECYRVARSDAVLVSFAGNPTYHRIASAVEAAGWRVRQMWGWVYRDGFITSAYPSEGFDRLAPAFDPIVFATKGKVLLNLEREGEDAWVKPRKVPLRFSERTSSHGKPAAKGRWPRNLVAADGIDGFQYFCLSRTMGGRSPDPIVHPNQKPLSLMRWIVGKLPVGWTILDPYVGSGTTLLAADELDHDAIGIESDPEYYARARRRLDAARAGTPLFSS